MGGIKFGPADILTAKVHSNPFSAEVMAPTWLLPLSAMTLLFLAWTVKRLRKTDIAR